MEVLLRHDVAAPRERGVLFPDHERSASGRAVGVLGPVHEPQQVALIEGAEPVHLVDHTRASHQPAAQPLGELEAQIQAMGADVEQQIAGRGRRDVPGAGKAGKGMQRGGARRAEESLPRLRAHAHHARQLALGDAKADRPPQPADVREHVPHVVLAARRHREHEEDRRLGDRAEDCLRLGRWHNASGFRAGRASLSATPRRMPGRPVHHARRAAQRGTSRTTSPAGLSSRKPW